MLVLLAPSEAKGAGGGGAGRGPLGGHPVRDLVAAVAAAAADLDLRLEDRGMREAPALDLAGRYA